MNNYDDIINYNYTGSKYHKKMSMEERAGMFSSFNALTGYSDMIKNEERTLNRKIYLSLDEAEVLNDKIKNVTCGETLSLIYFKEEEHDRGLYLKYTGILKKVDSTFKSLIFQDNFKVSFDVIIDITVL